MNAADGFSVSIPPHASEKSCFSRPASVERQSVKKRASLGARGYPGRPRKTSAESVSSKVEPRALAPLEPTLARSPRGRARRRRLARSSRSLAGKLRDSRADRSGFSGQVASPDPRTGRASARRLYGRRRWTTRRTRPTRRRGSSPVTPTACWATMPRRTTSTPSTCVSRPPRRSSRRAPAARQNASPSD